MKPSIKQGIRWYSSQRFEQALNEFKSIEQTASNQPELSYFIGLCLTQLEKHEEALLYLDKVVNSDFSILHIFQSRMVLGYIYSVTNRHKLAELEFKEILESGFESTQAYAALGYVLYYQNKIEESIENLKKALEIDPANANALNSLGYILAEEEQNLEYGLKLCRKSVSLSPNNSVYLDSLGWVLMKLGKIPEARINLRKALDLSPGNKEIAFHLRMVIKKLSNGGL